mgnify:CR=1 FL=1
MFKKIACCLLFLSVVACQKKDTRDPFFTDQVWLVKSAEFKESGKTVNFDDPQSEFYLIKFNYTKDAKRVSVCHFNASGFSGNPTASTMESRSATNGWHLGQQSWDDWLVGGSYYSVNNNEATYTDVMCTDGSYGDCSRSSKIETRETMFKYAQDTDNNLKFEVYNLDRPKSGKADPSLNVLKTVFTATKYEDQALLNVYGSLPVVQGHEYHLDRCFDEPDFYLYDYEMW